MRTTIRTIVAAIILAAVAGTAAPATAAPSTCEIMAKLGVQNVRECEDPTS